MKRLFVISCLAWITVHLCRYIHHPIPVLNGYLTDLMAVPAMSWLALEVTRRYIVRDQRYTYPLGYILFIASYVSIVFEWVLPHISSKYTGDRWDVVAYFAGGLFFYFSRRPVHDTQPTH